MTSREFPKTRKTIRDALYAPRPESDVPFYRYSEELPQVVPVLRGSRSRVSCRDREVISTHTFVHFNGQSIDI